MPEYRHSRSGSLNIPSGARPTTGPQPAGPAPGPGTGAAAARFDGPRSPPNTSHVPCKFFRQGACQAGNACPFSHDLGSASETICKYFAKGNCKFGPKCANIHILPDGRRINYGKNGVSVGSNPINAPRSNPNSANTSNSALTNSLYRADGGPYPAAAYSFEDRQSHHMGRQPSLDNGIPGLEGPYSRPTSNYGSPREDDHIRLGFGLSPANGKGLSVLDAPLPASFDSNGISNAARFPAAPWPSSVPSKFGLESPTPSLSSAKDSRTSETLKLLHTSAFGSSDYLGASSPPSAQPTIGEEYFGKRAMHSSRFAKPRLLSASVPKTASIDRDWEDEFPFGDDANDTPENYVPENLQDLLTPAEKARRGSMRADSDASAEGVTKYGSPIGAGSPGRWGHTWARHREQREEDALATRGAGSPFGHVGSPLRTSTLAQEMGGIAATNGSSRPSGNRSSSETMSMLSQQLQRSRLEEAAAGSGASGSPLLHPSSAARNIAPLDKGRGMERHISSGSISSSVTGRFTTPIDEEDPDFVFSMEDEEETVAARTRKRVSAGLNMNPWGSYAGAVSGKPGATSSGPSNAKDAMAMNGR